MKKGQWSEAVCALFIASELWRSAKSWEVGGRGKAQ